MAGKKEEEDSSFIWDQDSKLYYHHRSGFYHDPVGGWYYSTKDGSYYRFQNGNYVLLQTNYDSDCDVIAEDECQYGVQVTKTVQGKPNNTVGDETRELESVSDRPDGLVFVENQMPQNLPPPSEWLEDTLIELYLSGYSNQSADSSSKDIVLAQTDDLQHMNPEIDGAGGKSECQWDDKHDSADQGENASIEGYTSDEERWRAQYGQATHPEEESTSFHLVDLWDWTTVEESRKHGESRVTRLVGRLVKRSAKLHPSVSSSGGGLFKTAPVCKVHLDLVQVTSGQTYRLRTPSTKYLASASSYDSSNPTEDWSFPSLSISEGSHQFHDIGGRSESECSGQLTYHDRSTSSKKLLELERSSNYRDRAAERRALHGGFGVGPGQKKSSHDLDFASSPDFDPGEALRLSFGEGSYGKKILESMGWKEGETLGNSRKGLSEPLQAIGNKGLAGIGFNDNRSSSSSM